jgi:hypothetical protein
MKTEVIIAVNTGIDKLIQRRNALMKTKKDLLALMEEDYSAELRDVARLLYSKPVTQVSVERLFSALKIFKGDL